MNAYGIYYLMSKTEVFSKIVNYYMECIDYSQDVTSKAKLTMAEALKNTFGFMPDTNFKICGIMDCSGIRCNKCKYKGMSSKDFWNSPYEKISVKRSLIPERKRNS